MNQNYFAQCKTCGSVIQKNNAGQDIKYCCKDCRTNRYHKSKAPKNKELINLQ